ncbi:MAG TPA: hypothetical protein VFA86_03280 [Gammaproteobacteria bacterium]|nr:hypothetical protein [Gammaproteobacteria bacterium]
MFEHGPAARALTALAAAAILCAAVPAGAARLGDPTRPTPVHPHGSRHHAQRWRLDYTLVGPERRLAVINGSTVLPGHVVDGARLLRVGPGHVELRYRGHRIEVTMATSAVKRPARHRVPKEHRP